jgi:hypothetical protein
MIEFGAYLEATAAMSGKWPRQGDCIIPHASTDLLGPALD